MHEQLGLISQSSSSRLQFNNFYYTSIQIQYLFLNSGFVYSL